VKEHSNRVQHEKKVLNNFSRYSPREKFVKPRTLCT